MSVYHERTMSLKTDLMKVDGEGIVVICLQRRNTFLYLPLGEAGQMVCTWDDLRRLFFDSGTILCCPSTHLDPLYC